MDTASMIQLLMKLCFGQNNAAAKPLPKVKRICSKCFIRFLLPRTLMILSSLGYDRFETLSKHFLRNRLCAMQKTWQNTHPQKDKIAASKKKKKKESAGREGCFPSHLFPSHCRAPYQNAKPMYERISCFFILVAMKILTNSKKSVLISCAQDRKGQDRTKLVSCV